jgi:hypothetical protein
LHVNYTQVGGVRFNLDPLGEHPDEALWSALAEVLLLDRFLVLTPRTFTPADSKRLVILVHRIHTHL